MSDRSFEALLQVPALRPLAPVVLAAWQDEHLSPSELLTGEG